MHVDRSDEILPSQLCANDRVSVRWELGRLCSPRKCPLGNQHLMQNQEVVTEIPCQSKHAAKGEGLHKVRTLGLNHLRWTKFGVAQSFLHSLHVLR